MGLPVRSGFSKMLANRWLIDTCTLIEPGEITVLPSGGTQQGDPVLHENVPCRLATAGTQGSIRTFGDQLVAEAAWDLYLEAGTAINTAWQAVVNGETYAVIAVSEGTGAAYRQALLRSQEPV